MLQNVSGLLFLIRSLLRSLSDVSLLETFIVVLFIVNTQTFTYLISAIGGSQSDDQDVYTGTEESIPTVGGVATIGTVSTIEANPTTVGGYISGQPITPGQQLSYNAGMQSKSISMLSVK